MAVWWSKGDFSFLSMRVCVCLKIITPKGKQNYVRRITERAREFMDSSRKRNKKKKESREWESWRNKEKGRLWNQVECKGKKEMMESYGYTCVVDKMQEKKKRKKIRKRMDERKTKNTKSQFKNTTTIFSQ